jgi:hypothetical protein
VVQGLAAACELQGGLQWEVAYDGLRVAEVKGNGGGRDRLSRAGVTLDTPG